MTDIGEIDEDKLHLMSCCAAVRAIAHLLTVRDELELAGRPPGEFVAITRQAQETILNDLAIVGCLIREMAGGGRE
jgi:hypothetical protein